jgi:hypothetical protein
MRIHVHNIAVLIGAVWVASALSLPRSVSAAQWSAAPSVRVGGEHNDNYELTLQPHNSVTGSMIAPRLDLGVSSDIWMITGSAEAVQKRFSGGSGLDTDDRYYNFLTSYKTERSTWQVAGSNSKSSTLVNEQISPNTGLVQVQKTYDTHSVSPSWTWAMNELTQLQLAYSFNSVSYVNGQSSGLFDYNTRDISAQLSNQLNEKDKIFVSAGYSIFNAPATTLESKSAWYQAGISRTFSETTNGTLSAGTRKTASEQVLSVCTVFFGPFCLQTANETFSSEGSSSIYSGSFEKRYETTVFNIRVSRALDPSGLGGQIQTDSQIVGLNRKFTSKLTGTFSVSNYLSKAETGNVTGVDSHYYAVEPGLHWMWAQEWNVDFTYQYRHIKRANEDEPASSNATYLTIRYAWPKMDFSI